jgi:hypothetical protein
VTGAEIIDKVLDPSGAPWALLGVGGTLLLERYRKRMATLRWDAHHFPIASALDDARFGKIEVTYNGAPALNLFLTTVRVQNASGTDLTDLELNLVFDENSMVRNAVAAVENAGKGLAFAPTYEAALREFGEKEKQRKEKGIQPDAQDVKNLADVMRRRDYIVPVLNRGTTVEVRLLVQRFQANTSPYVTVHTEHAGVKVAHRGPQPPFTIFGVDLRIAGPVGLFAMGAAVWTLAALYGWNWSVAAAFLMGTFAQLTGILLVRGFRVLRGLFD